jgi:trimeric autotransporter adhesin
LYGYFISNYQYPFDFLNYLYESKITNANMKNIILRTIFFLTLTTSIATSAQVGIGTVVPDGALDITSTTDGLIIPRVTLTALNSASPLTSPIISELVYNTGTSLSPAGFFYWDGSKWVQLMTTVATSWNTIGNSGLSGTTNFIGTTDAVDLAFRRSNTAAGKIGATSTALGVSALQSGVATNSTAIGNNALKVSTGNDNVAVGQNALLNCASTAQWNTAIGTNALQGINSNAAQNNTAIGYNAMSVGTGTINQCTSVGSKALFSNSADNNTAIGFQALQGKGAGTENTAIGCKA